MKRIILFFTALLLTQFIHSQQSISSKRIKINNPSYNQLLQIKTAGFDLACDAIFENNNLIMELGQHDLDVLNNININYEILIQDLIAHYREKNERELPRAQAQLEQLKSQSAFRESLSTSSISVDNLIQYEGCTEVNWTVPANFNLGSMGGCLTYAEVLAELDQMRALYPNLISVKTDASPTNQITHGNSFTNGGQYASWPGQTIYYVRISDNPDVDEANEPESLYSGMTHAREVSSMMNLIYYMWYILENYDSDSGIKNLVDNHEMYFIPVANPDGLLWNEQIAPSGGGQQRKNLGPYNTGNNSLRGVDLNRNYDYFWGSNPIYGGSSGTTTSNTYRGPSAFSEPETQIVRDFSATRNFKTAMNHHATSNLIPHAYNGYPAAPASGREAEYAKFCHDMTRYNRYIYGEAPDILTIANGDMSDWMLGGVADVNGSTGSGQAIMALAPENGSWLSSDGEGSFWPSPTKIVEIAQRAVRMNFINAYHSGKFAQFHDFNTTDITSTSGNFKFGLEYIGQALGDITLNIIPISSNITSISSPATQTGWNKLEQRTITAAYVLNAGIQPNETIEFEVTLSNDDGYVMYQANIVKTYNPIVIFSDNPDATGTNNWTSSGGTWSTTNDAYSGSAAITDSPSGAYANNSNKSISLTTSLDLSASNQVVVQYFAKWDLERNFDYVQIQGSTNGTNWVDLCGKYTKPASSISTNRYSSGNSTNTSTGKSTSDQNNQPTGELIYDGDTMDKWVMEELLIDASNNSFLLGAANAQFRFLLNSDNSNRADGYPTTFDGFSFDDFKVISLQAPCVTIVPVGLAASGVSITEATIDWNVVASASYDLRYRETGASDWTDVLDLSTASYSITGLTPLTEYEVQVRSKCDAVNTSAYSPSVIFTTEDLNYCTSASNNVNDEFISRVQINTIDNASGAQFYSDFTSLSTTLTKEATYSITITPTWTGTVYNEAYSVWIDYNRDGDFLDAEEQVWTQSPTQATPVSGNFTIPAFAVEASTRMRVSMKYNDIPASCETFTYGEVEDYTIVLEASGPDTTPPIISLNGNATIDLDLGDTYNEEGATAVDNVDGDITANIIIGGDTVDTNIVNTYLVTYNVNDAAGNAATEVIRTVNVNPDTTPPIITLIGASTINLNLGDNYIEQGATATDNLDGDITASIMIGGDTVDSNTVGSYVVTYDVFDAAGNAATQVTRTINVTEPTNGCSGGISSFPYTEGFENTLGAWTQSTADDINWTVDANGTPSNGTGPSSAFQGNYYIYVEASGNGTGYPNRQAILNSPCFDLSSLTDANFSFNYHQFGSNNMGTIDLEASNDGGLTWVSIWTSSGNLGNSWLSASIDLEAYVGGGLQLRFNRITGGTWQADIAIDNIALIEDGSTGCIGGISSFPYSEGFENTFGSWTQSSFDDLNWTLRTNGTPSNGTGPSGAFQGAYYIYVEASGNGTGYPNKQAILNSPCFDLNNQSSATINFNYNQFGSSDMGTIDLEASNDGGLTWTSIWASSGNLGNSWQSASVDLTAYAGSELQLRFNRITGGIWQADIAIDNINFSTTSTSRGSQVNTIIKDDIKNLKIFPNPVKGDYLNVSTTYKNVTYEVYNAIGQVIAKGNLNNSIDVSKLESAVYNIKFYVEEEILVKRFIKQ